MASLPPSSPDALLHRGTPPIYFENEWGLTRPATVTETNYKVHSPAWALGFQKLARHAGVVYHVKYPDHPTGKYQDIWDFIVQELKAAAPDGEVRKGFKEPFKTAKGS